LAGSGLPSFLAQGTIFPERELAAPLYRQQPLSTTFINSMQLLCFIILVGAAAGGGRDVCAVWSAAEPATVPVQNPPPRQQGAQATVAFILKQGTPECAKNSTFSWMRHFQPKLQGRAAPQFDKRHHDRVKPPLPPPLAASPPGGKPVTSRQRQGHSALKTLGPGRSDSQPSEKAQQ
jgi:hypothetical protein